jgi:hypothetical protein
LPGPTDNVAAPAVPAATSSAVAKARENIGLRVTGVYNGDTSIPCLIHEKNRPAGRLFQLFSAYFAAATM